MAKFTLWKHGSGTPETVNVKDGENPKEVFERVTKSLEIDPKDVYSFFEVGKSFRHDSMAPSGLSVSMWDRSAGREWIFDVRDLPSLSNDAFVILGSSFGLPRSSLKLDNQERQLTERARAAFDELIETGLITENPVEGGYVEGRRYTLTDAGRDFPRNLHPDFARKYGNFPLLELISQPEDDLEPGM
jgi:hypothetical protein